MKFYNREKELAELKRIEKLSFYDHSRMVVITGRRRIGKTSLVKRAFADGDMLYLFVGRKSEKTLVREFADNVRNTLGVFVPDGLADFANLLRYIMEIGKTRHFTLVIDEFQEFYNINESIFSEMQNIWDEYRLTTHVNLIISGSVYSLMQKIFSDSKEPLFNRADNIIKLKEFNISVIKQIMTDYNPNYQNDDLLTLYAISGGVPKYMELLCDNTDLTQKGMIDFFFSELSPFLEEGRNMLVSEFNKNYGSYFSIMQEISSGHNAQSQIEDALGGSSVGGYLTKLEDIYGLIKKVRPVLSQQNKKNAVKYVIHDNFLNFWFRYVERNRSFIELQNYDDLKTLVQNDYTTYTGRVLEKYFIKKMAEEGGWKEINGWWSHKPIKAKDGSMKMMEVDIVAISSFDKRATIAEVKRDAKRYDHDWFIEKVEYMKQNVLPKYKIDTTLLTLENM